MSDALCDLASYAVCALWLIPLVSGAGWLASLAMRPSGASARHKVWVTTLLGAVVIPLFPIAHHLLSSSVLHGDEIHRAGVRVIAIGNMRGGGLHDLLMLPYHAIRTLCWLYVGMTFYFCMRLLQSLLCTFALVSKASPCNLPLEWTNILVEIKQALGLGCKVMISAEVSSPVTVSFPDPLILLPENFLALATADDLRAALAHECAHIQRHDFVKNLCYEIAALPVAFHPMTWWIKSQLTQTREVLCDAFAITHSVQTRPYIRSLLRLAMITAESRVASTNVIGVFD